MLHLEAFSDPFQALLVDSQAEYAEIDLGLIEPISQTLDLSSFGEARDWALVLILLPEPGVGLLLSGPLLAVLLNRPNR